MPAPPYIAAILARMHQLREQRGMSRADVERELILGAGWIEAYETGAIVPSFDVLLAILHLLGSDIRTVTDGLAEPAPTREIVRKLRGIQRGNDLAVEFDYADYDSTYVLPNATVAQFDAVIREMRDGLARAVGAAADAAEAVKSDSVAKTFLRAVQQWPHANPSDLWWFVVYRAFTDPFNHPSTDSRRDFGQSWRRTGGWALEEVLVRHYGPWLARQGVRLAIISGREKTDLIGQLLSDRRLEPDKVDVLLTTQVGAVERCFGVVHVKASFAERRTDDVPMSQALVAAGYTSPLWTMDCKSGPGVNPVNRGELGAVWGGTGRDQRSDKRKDIEDDGYFSNCFSYNSNTAPTPAGTATRGRVIVCNFTNPDDAFGQFIVAEAARFRANPPRR